MKKSLCFLLGIMILSQSCISGKNKDEVLQDEHINANLRTSVAAMNKQVYSCMGNNDAQHLFQLFSDSLVKNLSGDFEKKFLPQIQKVLTGKDYKVFKEVYINSSTIDSFVNLASGKGDSAYILKIKPIRKETYVSLLIAGDSVNEVMLALVYGNYNGAWKLDMITGEDYTIGGKNAVGHFKAARQLYNSGDIVDAVNTMYVAGRCAIPGGSFFRYALAGKMSAFNDSITNEAKGKYHFPITVSIKTQPQVFNIHYEIVRGTLAPIVMYQSSIDVKDTVALKIENDELRKNIGKEFYGLAQNNQYILYRAYNVLPDGRNDPRYYGFVVKTE